jgi:ppGpp synthetase/RelA/SpoT-type nucleotidyltranferase
MIPSELSQKIGVLAPFLEELKKFVGSTISPFAEKCEFPFYVRIKREESVAEKIEMGRYKKFSEIDDLVAFTLIIPTSARENEVLQFCNDSFLIQEVKSKAGTNKDPDVFRFDCTRIIAKAKPTTDLSGGQPSIFDQLFEVQVRTAFEHAWSVATHDLVYKGSQANWKRLRLAAQLKATSESLDAAIASFEQLSSGIVESPSKAIKEHNGVVTVVSKLIDNGILPVELRPTSTSRVCGNIIALIRSIRPKLELSEIVNYVESEIIKLDYIPKSISLYQLVLGIICSGSASHNLDRSICHVTGELIAMYPRTRALSNIFMYDQ